MPRTGRVTGCGRTACLGWPVGRSELCRPRTGLAEARAESNMSLGVFPVKSGLCIQRGDDRQRLRLARLGVLRFGDAACSTHPKSKQHSGRPMSRSCSSSPVRSTSQPSAMTPGKPASRPSAGSSLRRPPATTIRAGPTFPQQRDSGTQPPWSSPPNGPAAGTLISQLPTDMDR